MGIRMKNKLKQRAIKGLLMRVVDRAWEGIRNRKVVVIQKYIRGYLTRKKYKSQIKKIKEAGRQCKMRMIAVKI